MSDEVLIEQIREAMRTEVADLVVPGDLLERITAGRRLSWRGPGFGWLAPVLAVGIAAVVAVVAVTSLSHRGGRAPTGTASIPKAARGLASQLGVLRRPQRASDRMSPWAARETQSLLYGHSRLIPDLTRSVGAVNLGRYGHARAYLIVETRPGRVRHSTSPLPPLPAPQMGDLASLVFVGRIWHGESGFGVEPTVALDSSPQTYLDASDPSLGGPAVVDTGLGTAASIVPDGVARVKWVFRVGSGPRTIVVRPRVHGNVALAARLPSVLTLKTAIWYRPDGEVMTSFGEATGVLSSSRARALRRAFEASVRQPVAPVLLRHFRVLRLRADLARRAHRGLPDGAEARLIEPNPLGLNLAQARLVPYPLGPTLSARPGGIWVVPGAQGIALQASDSTYTFSGGTSAALNGELFTVGRVGPHTEMVWGLLPDGDRSVTVLLPNREFVDRPVIDNVFSVTVPITARALVVRTASGRTVRWALGRPTG